MLTRERSNVAATHVQVEYSQAYKGGSWTVVVFRLGASGAGLAVAVAVAVVPLLREDTTRDEVEAVEED